MLKFKLTLTTLLLICSCTQKISEDFISGIKFKVDEIDLSTFYKDPNARNLENLTALRNSSNSVLRVNRQVLAAQEALKNIDQKSNEIKMMFAPQVVPYMGQITKDINCTQAVEINNKILENDTEISLLLNLTATERLIYGSCISDQEIYKSQFLMLYCKSSKTFYEIKYFYDKESAYKKQIAHCL